MILRFLTIGAEPFKGGGCPATSHNKFVPIYQSDVPGLKGITVDRHIIFHKANSNI